MYQKGTGKHFSHIVELGRCSGSRLPKSGSAVRCFEARDVVGAERVGCPFVV